ncbi:hypothetical protein HY468_04060 [Candidatus Roizmanbacteria bacterium]|nr:hypothetical protein [Candidatus Roizmanbacteria bacterium]
MKHYRTSAGFGILEIIIAMAVLLMIGATIAVTTVGSFSLTQRTEDEEEATRIAQEGIEAVRSLKHRGWQTPFLAVNCNLGCGVSPASGTWEYAGSSTSHGKFARTVTITTANRNGGAIVESGGIPDPDTKQVTSTVSWDFSPTRHNQVVLKTYVTQYEKSITSTCTNWGSTLIVSDTFNIDPGIQNASKVVTNGDHAYVVRNNNGGTNPDLAIVNISNPINVTQESAVDLDAAVYDVFFSNNLLFLATDRNGRELWIIDVSNPANPNINYAFASLPADARGVHVDGTYAYVVTRSNSGNEFFIFDISSLPNLSGPWGVNLGVDGRAVFAEGNRALVATPNNSRELMIVDTTNKQVPLANNGWSYNTPSCGADGTGIFSIGDTAFLTTQNCGGAGEPEVYPLDIVNYKSSVTLIGSGLDIGAGVNDLYIDSANQAYLATDVANGEFMILNVSVPSAISEIARRDLSDEVFGVHVTGCIGVAATGANTDEIQVIIPAP